VNKLKVSFAPSIRRLPSYLLAARQALELGDEYISATIIARDLDFEPIQVRKDLAITGVSGKPKRGYPLIPLVAAIESFLDWDQRRDALVVGAGNLGSALIGFPGFTSHGLHIIAAFDADKTLVGKQIHGIPVFALEELKQKVESTGIYMAILTVPHKSAQIVADKLVEAGIKAIWNFTNNKVKTPKDVVVQNEDLSSGYAMLSMKFRLNHERQA